MCIAMPTVSLVDPEEAVAVRQLWADMEDTDDKADSDAETLPYHPEERFLFGRPVVNPPVVLSPHPSDGLSEYESDAELSSHESNAELSSHDLLARV